VGDREEHPAVFPVVLSEFPIRIYTDEDEADFEPCGGSGTTTLAGQRTGHLADKARTGPPYNVAYQGGTAARMTIANDAFGGGFLDFLRPALANMLQVIKGAC
jgi:DNA modification methylase